MCCWIRLPDLHGQSGAAVQIQQEQQVYIPYKYPELYRSPVLYTALIVPIEKCQYQGPTHCSVPDLNKDNPWPCLYVCMAKGPFTRGCSVVALGNTI